MRRRTVLSLAIVLVVLAGFGVMLYLRFKAPPEVARLLPESDAMIYVRLGQVRSLTHFDQTPVTRSADFQAFIDGTGIVPERDLDAAAFALHRMADPRGPNGPVAYSEVFVGHFDAARLTRYLAAHARAQETYDSQTIYSLPVEGRTLRVSQLGYDTIAASNMPTPEQIHSILDRYRAGASPFSGSSLLARRYGDVPLLSEAWGIGRIGLPFAQDGMLTLMGLQLPLPVDTEFVASVRYSGSVHLRVEEFATDAAAAGRTVDTMTSLLGVVRGLGDAQPARTPAETAMHDALATLKFEEKGSRVLLTGSATVDQLKQIASAAPPPAPPDPLLPMPLPSAPTAGRSPANRSMRRP